MQRDNLEQFISSNRDAFDDAVPSLKVWAEIDKSLGRRGARRRTLLQQLRVAAAVLLLLFAGGVAGHYLASPGDFNSSAATLQQIDPEYAEMAQYYERQINEKTQQLAGYDQGQVVLKDFEQLDEIMEELREDLRRAPKGKEEQIIENLIKSYQTKVQILERVLERIDATNEALIKPEDNEVSI